MMRRVRWRWRTTFRRCWRDLLAARGVTSGQAVDLLNPTLKRLLPEPLSLKDMDKAVARARAAIERGERIAVFGDYDVDGSTSAALLSDFLTALGSPPAHLHSRSHDGRLWPERRARCCC